jgi:hypothetical protein
VAFHSRHEPGASPQAAAESCAFGAQYGQSPLPLLERSQIVGHIWIFRRQRFDIADFDQSTFSMPGHLSLNIKRRTSNVQYRIGSWTSNLKFLTAKIEQA